MGKDCYKLKETYQPKVMCGSFWILILMNQIQKKKKRHFWDYYAKPNMDWEFENIKKL